MNLKETIYRRKSTRSFTTQAVDGETLQKIKDFLSDIKPLYPDIRVQTEIISRNDIKCIFPWVTQQLIAVYSEEKDGYLENIGFMMQQLDLYMQSIGLGVCWLGMGKMNKEYTVKDKDSNLKFVIMLTFGYPKDKALRTDSKEFKRHSLSEIADTLDKRLEPARLAPSSVNSQPWYFTHEDDAINLYCVKRGFFKIKVLGNMNLIDVGICLAHMYVSNTETFNFFKVNNPKVLDGYGYIGSFTI